MKILVVIGLVVCLTIQATYQLNDFKCENEQSTLCQLANGTKACCPVKDAVCCLSGDFCCPKGFKCDVNVKQCISEKFYMPFHLKLEKATLSDATDKNSDQLCPDNETSCSDFQTCCLFNDNTYGCCPLKNAVCCDDHIHCCPKDYICNPDQGKCDRKLTENTIDSVEWFVKEVGKKVKDVPCPGGSASCPDGNTCCQLSSGQWGCCPLANAVCCSDHEHCCPSGYKCDVKDGRCLKGETSIPFFSKTEAKTIQVKDVPCPGGSASCPDGNTCCQLSSGQWGCCPLVNAVCCSDHEHCCPSGYKCDVKDGRCLKGELSIPFYSKTEAKPIEVKDVPCPGGSASCPDGNTCCQLSSGQWGCCPLANAVCCSDHEHCCPSGYKCDVKDGRCLKGDISIPFYLKAASKQIKQKVEDVPCPGGSASCPDGNTCCQLSSGQWGCCPLANAVCCSDHEHCCPSGYKCDVKDGRCLKGDLSIPFYLKIASKPIKKQVADLPCPGGSASCPDGNTCCQLSSGQWGCCPLANAVCCSDHEHCCPSGYKCDVKDGRCLKGDISIPFYLKAASKQIKQKVDDVPCPGGSASCPDGNTCCQLSSGQWGCCPLANAVCCSDHEHCCPSGYKCDVKDGRCLKGETSIPFYSKTEAKPIQVKDVPCPGGSASCPDGNTCCQLSSGQWGCCPLANAVCCSDHEHCCPSGYKCDVKDGRCLKGDLSIPFFKKNEAKQVDKSLCANGASCSTDSTCCQMNNNQTGCCPLANSVCCKDGQHCCPSGYICSENGDTCFSETKRIMSYTISRHFVEIDNHHEHGLGSVPCPDGSFCQNGNTCCKLCDNTYGCCPLPSAVCCSDFLHCCPHGTVCDVVHQMCNSTKDENIRVPWYSKLTSRQLIKKDEKLNKIESAVVCDAQTTCSPMSTCCRMLSGEYGCCPYDDAVCCGTHCCPKNNKCGKELGECIADEALNNEIVESSGVGTGVNILNWHTIERLAHEKNSLKIENKRMAVCPGGEVKCSNGTCCQKADSTYSCCPYENGTCCGSHGYCCPDDYTCDPKLEACVYNDDLHKNKRQNTLFNLIETIDCKGLDGSVFKCPSTYSCCASETINECCPIPKSISCENTEYCCPESFKCVTKTNQILCVNDDVILNAVKKVPSFF